MKQWLIVIFILSLLSTGCQTAQKTSQVTMPLYTKADLQQIYDELTEKSFVDIPKKCKLVFKNMNVFGMASHVSLNLYINIDKVNRYQWPREAVVGLIAHELSHMVSYERRSFLGRMWFIRHYPFSIARKRIVEHEADEIAIERGYGREIVQERIYQFKDEDKKSVKIQKKVYYWPETLESMISGK